MKYLKRILIAVVAVIVVVVAAAVIIASTIDLNSYKDTITAEIEAATGRKVTIKGDIEKSILTLSPAIVVYDVAFANAPWGSRPNMVTAKRVELAVDLWPLLSGTISVRHFLLVGADIFLETDGKGGANWALGTGGQSGATKKPAAPAPADGGGLPHIAAIDIEGTTITFRDGATKLVSKIGIDDIELRAPDQDGPIELKTKATYQGAPVITEGRLGSVAAATGGAKNFPIDLKVRFGDSDLAVKLIADLSGKTPALSGSIKGRELDIDKVTSAFGGQSSGGQSSGGGSSGGQSSGGGGGRLFSADPLPVGILHAVNAMLDIAIGTLKAGGRSFEDVAAKVALKDGNLVVDPIGLRTAGGTIKGAFGIDARTDKPKLTLKLKGAGLSLSDVSGQGTVGSKLNLTVDLTGVGASMRDIASTARGPVIAMAGAGPIRSGVLSFISTNLLQAIPVLGNQQRLALNCMVARFNFADGNGNSQILVVDTTRMTIAGRGVVSLRNETLDLILVPSTKGKSLASVAALVPVRVRGPLTNPRATPDPRGVSKEVIGSIFGTLDMSVDIVGSLLGRKSSSSASPCATARARATGAPKPAGRKGGGTGKPGLIDRLNPFKR